MQIIPKKLTLQIISPNLLHSCLCC